MTRCLALCFALLWLVSETRGQGAAGGFRPAEIDAMVLLPPLGAVSLIGPGNRATFDANASADASEMLRQAIFRHDEKLHLQGQLLLKDSAAQRTIARRAAQAFGLLAGRRKAAMAQPQPWLDSLLTARRQRYGLVSYVAGFTRTPANRRPLIARDLGIGLLTLGAVVPVTPNAATKIGVFIYDAQAHRVVYYRVSAPAEQDPLARFGEIIDRELTNLLAKDFNLPGQF